ncbi:hypothetical protein Tco_1304813 [Tanacetum coccineum]
MRLRRKSLQSKLAEEPSDVPALLIECQHVAVLSLARLTKKIERAFLAWLVKSSFWPYLAGDDDVKLTAEKDWAFRRAARWCGTELPDRVELTVTRNDLAFMICESRLQVVWWGMTSRSAWSFKGLEPQRLRQWHITMGKQAE